jgi:hypothetical protein
MNLPGLVGEINENRAGFKQRQRVCRPGHWDRDGRDLVIGIERQKLRRHLLIGLEAHEMRLVGRPVSSSMIETLTPFGVGSEYS